MKERIRTIHRVLKFLIHKFAALRRSVNGHMERLLKVSIIQSFTSFKKPMNQYNGSIRFKNFDFPEVYRLDGVRVRHFDYLQVYKRTYK